MSCNKVWFFIHGKSAEKTAQLVSVVLKKYPFIKVVVEDSKCILVCHDMGKEPSTWIVQKLLESKKWLGKFHPKHPCHNVERVNYLIQKYNSGICRFGFFDCYEYPSDLKLANYFVDLHNNIRKKLPLYLAEKNALISSGHIFEYSNNTKITKREHYIDNLIKFSGMSRKDAINLIDQEFPDWKNLQPDPPPKMIKLPSKKMALELAKKLAFLSPKRRAKQLKENIMDILLFRLLLENKGAAWILENIGPIPGILE